MSSPSFATTAWITMATTPELEIAVHQSRKLKI
ncbi:hypothetical protein COLO4_36926 [Corchorus olitorius]|uniref:Uncharacterized protein n=1 Tax=Corchorus olitorius TaxID=93759 RepID=A0A1R3G450_9ROSI|nr:hypothetical protein COLO4_36926 [Corchorus olitorius]